MPVYPSTRLWDDRASGMGHAIRSVLSLLQLAHAAGIMRRSRRLTAPCSIRTGALASELPPVSPALHSSGHNQSASATHANALLSAVGLTSAEDHSKSAEHRPVQASLPDCACAHVASGQEVPEGYDSSGRSIASRQAPPQAVHDAVCRPPIERAGRLPTSSTLWTWGRPTTSSSATTWTTQRAASSGSG